MLVSPVRCVRDLTSLFSFSRPAIFFFLIGREFGRENFYIHSTKLSVLLRLTVPPVLIHQAG